MGLSVGKETVRKFVKANPGMPTTYGMYTQVVARPPLRVPTK
jgi:hypothetical protein